MDKNTEILHYAEWQCGANVLKFVKPLIMGILNLTPDSFFDVGKYTTTESALNRTQQMLAEGADIIDIGAVSTRPGAENIDIKTELSRILPVLKILVKVFPETIFSIDTYRAEVVRATYNEGAALINDISAGTMDSEMLDAVAASGLPYILMHMQGTPKNMQQNPYYDDVTDEVLSFFEKKTELLNKKGIKQIILDPGFGFGKTVEHNYQLLSSLNLFTKSGMPVMAGLSHKSMIWKILGKSKEATITGTVALNMFALIKGVSILRVHDVKEAADVIKIYEQMKNC